MRRAYLDHAATSPLSREAREILMGDLPFGNPSSVHAEGRAARAVLDEARVRLAAALGVLEEEVVFTGSGTEADNLALRGVAWAAAAPVHVVTTAIEHEAVRRTARWLEAKGHAAVTVVPPEPDGVLSAGRVIDACRADTALVSVMAVNNEVGTLQPVAEIGAACAARGIAFHVDAVQAPGRVAVAPRAWQADLLTLSPHKVGGPKGVGVLVARRGLKLQPPLTGGEQEAGLRPGTENVGLALAGAVALATAISELNERRARLQGLTLRLETGLLALPGVSLNGSPGGRAPGIVSIACEGCEAVTLVQALDLAGVAASSGSACSSGSVLPSAVLRAMGLPEERCRGSVRLSLGAASEDADIDHVLSVLPGILATARSGR